MAGDVICEQISDLDHKEFIVKISDCQNCQIQNLDCAINCWKRNCLHENEPETNVRQRSNYPGQSLNDTFNALFGKVFPE